MLSELDVLKGVCARLEGARIDYMLTGKEDLILSKLVWASESRSDLQLRDVRNLLSTGVDRSYLRRWAGELGVGALLEECMNG